jgi:hypothetical protein
MKYLNFANRVLKNIVSEILITIIDLSGSMGDDDWKPSRKAGATKANIELIKMKAQCHPQDRVAIIGFGTKAEVLHEPVCLTDGMKSLCSALEGPPDMGSTNFTAALTLAEACLFGKSVSAGNGIGRKITGIFSQLLYGPPSQHTNPAGGISPSNDCLRRIILLTDGDYNRGGSPLQVASRLKKAGVVIDCIGIGGSPEAVNESALKEIASRNPGDGSIRYCFIGDQQELIRRYESLAHHIRPA